MRTPSAVLVSTRGAIFLAPRLRRRRLRRRSASSSSITTSRPMPTGVSSSVSSISSSITIPSAVRAACTTSSTSLVSSTLRSTCVMSSAGSSPTTRPRTTSRCHSSRSTPPSGGTTVESRASAPPINVLPFGPPAKLATTPPHRPRVPVLPGPRGAGALRDRPARAPDRSVDAVRPSSRRTAAAIRLRASASASTSRSTTAARSSTSRASGSACCKGRAQVAACGGNGEERAAVQLVGEQRFDQPRSDRVPVLDELGDRHELGVLALSAARPVRPTRGPADDARRARRAARDRRRAARPGPRPGRHTTCARSSSGAR